MLRRSKDRQAALERGEYVQPRWKDWEDHRRDQEIWRRTKNERVPGSKLTNHEIRLEVFRGCNMEPKPVYDEMIARSHYAWDIATKKELLSLEPVIVQKHEPDFRTRVNKALAEAGLPAWNPTEVST